MAENTAKKPSIAHLIHGYIGAGKTTFARYLESEERVVRFSVDEWMVAFYGKDPPVDDFVKCRDSVFRFMEAYWTRLLELGVGVVLDFGFWRRDFRDDVRARLESMGVPYRLYNVTCNEEVMLERARKRNQENDETALYIADNTFDVLKNKIEPLDSDELWFDVPPEFSGDGFIFKKLEETDLALIEEWLQTGHVKKHWDDGGTWEESYEKYIARTSSDVVQQYIAWYQGKPIGYIQRYWASKVGDGWWEDAADSTVGIDLYIGEEGCLGKGLGRRMIMDFTDIIFTDQSVRKIIADPSPKNPASIKCFESSGFARVGEIDTPDGPALFMEKSRP